MVRYAYRSDGQRYVDIVAPSGKIRRLPIEWTDCWISMSTVEQQVTKLTVEQLLTMTQHLKQKLSETDMLGHVTEANTTKLVPDCIALGSIFDRNTSESLETVGSIDTKETMFRGTKP